jgi:hypothetical protein
MDRGSGKLAQSKRDTSRQQAEKYLPPTRL